MFAQNLTPAKNVTLGRSARRQRVCLRFILISYGGTLGRFLFVFTDLMFELLSPLKISHYQLPRITLDKLQQCYDNLLNERPFLETC